MADDWAAKEVRAFISRQQAKDSKDEKELSDRKLKQAWVEKKWDQLVQAVSQRVSEFNKKAQRELLVFELSATDTISVGRCDTHTKLELKIDLRTLELSQSGGNAFGIYRLEIKQGDAVDYKKDGTFYSPDDIARAAISSLLRNDSNA